MLHVSSMYSSAMVRPHLLPPSNSEVKHSLEVGEAAEPEPEPKEWAVTILNLTESFDSLTLASRCVTTSIQKVLRNKDWTRNYVWTYLAMGRFRRTKINLCLSIQTSIIDSFNSTSDTYVSPPVLLDIGDDDTGDLTVQENVPFPEIVTCLSDVIYYKNFSICLYFGQTIGIILPVLTEHVWENLDLHCFNNVDFL